MELEILPILTNYHGIDRIFSDQCFGKLEESAKMACTQALQHYCQAMDQFTGKDKLDIIKFFYQGFKYYKVDCEMILYGQAPINHFFNEKITFIGLDCVHAHTESLLFDAYLNKELSQHLNAYGLFNDLNTLNQCIKTHDSGYDSYEIYYVYKVE